MVLVLLHGIRKEKNLIEALQGGAASRGRCSSHALVEYARLRPPPGFCTVRNRAVATCL